MTNKDILLTAMRQSAIDSGCRAEDFAGEKSRVVISRPHKDARRYLELPFLCDFTSYGDNIVASVSPALAEIAGRYIEKYPVEHCFETPNVNALIDQLRPLGLGVCFMAEYFLPDLDALCSPGCGLEIRLMGPEAFAGLYLPQWANALSKRRSHLDMLAMGAFDGGRLVGLAGCSADCDSMWQIGVDVLPEYRRRGIAACITGRLAQETLARGKVPFYCCAWSNIKSARNAIKCGFRPAWVQMTVKSAQFIADMNK